MTSNRNARARRRTTRSSQVVQLRLLAPLADDAEWVLDEQTRRRGRRGVAEAREVLRQARPPEPARRAS